MNFTIEEPRSIDDVVTLLSEGDETTRILAGGTGLSLLMRYGFFEPTSLVSLRLLGSELTGIDVTPEGGLRLGAMTTLRDLEDAEEVAIHAPLLHQALSVLATIRLRNVAQLGGAIAHGHPQMDTPPVLLALDAKVRVVSLRGERLIPADELFLGYYETAVEDDELITEVLIDPVATDRATYRKVTARAADDWPMLGIAAHGGVREGAVESLAVAVGALTESAQRMTTIEEALLGREPTPDVIADAAATGADELDYDDKPAASASYQRHLVQIHLGRALTEVLTNGGTTGER